MVAIGGVIWYNKGEGTFLLQRADWWPGDDDSASDHADVYAMASWCARQDDRIRQLMFARLCDEIDAMMVAKPCLATPMSILHDVANELICDTGTGTEDKDS